MNEHTPKNNTLKTLAVIGMIVLVAGGIAVLIAGMMRFVKPQPQPAMAVEPVLEIETEPAPEPEPEPAPEPEEVPAEDVPQKVYEMAKTDENTKTLDLQVYSEGAFLIDMETNTVLAQKNPDAKIYPASMTKVLTALVACENITDWDTPITMTQEMIDAAYLDDLTMAGFLAGEQIKPLDLVYGAILPSGAEATLALATHIAGSEEAFAQMMNEKAASLGLTNCHFVDASGFHNEDHYCTMQDMAVIMQAALDNEICRDVLMSVTYTSKPTEQNPEGVTMTNKFLARMEQEKTNGARFLAAKTGYTAEAGNCCVSYGISSGGKECIAVTANALVFDFTILDHIALYSLYAD